MHKKFFYSLLVAGLVILGTLIVVVLEKDKRAAATVKEIQKVGEVDQ